MNAFANECMQTSHLSEDQWLEIKIKHTNTTISSCLTSGKDISQIVLYIEV